MPPHFLPSFSSTALEFNMTCVPYKSLHRNRLLTASTIVLTILPVLFGSILCGIAVSLDMVAST